MESTGQAKAEAQSRAKAAKIEGDAAVEQAKLKAEASQIEAVSWNLNSFHNDLCAHYMWPGLRKSTHVSTKITDF